MANSDDPVNANFDVIQGARAIRTNPALLAALASPPTTADPATVGVATQSGQSPDPFEGQDIVDQRGAYVQKLAAAAGRLANAPLPPRRPSDLGAINALALPPGFADDATLGALIRQGGSPLATPPASSFSSNAPILTVS